MNVNPSAKKGSNNLKPVRLFPEVYDISDFVVDEFPNYHPSTKRYTRYWTEQERYCVEGKWGEDRRGDLGGWRYMPGNLYFYVNMCIINDEDEETGSNVTKIRPKLRDIEWYVLYGWMVARGFSGFKDDDEYTCHRLVKKISEDKELSPKEEKLLEKRKEHLLKPNGDWKEYVDAKEYLYKTHEEPLGLPLYHNNKLNLFILGARGFGKSFIAANAILLHEFIFFGKKYYNEAYLNNPAGVEIVAGAAKSDKINETTSKMMATMRHLEVNVGSWGKGKNFIPGWFHLKTTGKPKTGYKGGLEHKYEKKTGSGWQTSGTGTSLKAVTYTTENPEAAVGTRPTVLFLEEVGLCGNLLDVHGANETTQIRRTKFGSSLYLGTGGNIEKITEPRMIFEDPEAYNFVPYEDKFENRSKPIGLFMPAYYVDNDFKGPMGNTDIEKAFEQEMIIRAKKKDTGSASALDNYTIYRPIVPSEMFMSKGNLVFPTARLRDRLTELETTDIDKAYAAEGEFLFDDNEDVYFNTMIEDHRKPLEELNLDVYKGNITGCWIMYEDRPRELPERRYRHSLYKVVYDPVKDDEGGTSLASVLVYKGYADSSWEGGMQDTIVAEWIGRYDRVDQAHQEAVKAALYYNATVMPEINIPDFVRYCRSRNKGKYRHLLQPSPREAIKKVVKNPGFSYDVGIDMSSPRLHVQAEQQIRQWLLTTITTKEDGTKVQVVDKLLSRRLLRELIYYERDRNLDHVSSLKLLAIWLSQEVEDPIAAKDVNEEEYDEIDQLILNRLKSKTTKDNAFYNF